MSQSPPPMPKEPETSSRTGARGLALIVTMSLAFPLMCLIRACAASLLWRWFLTGLHPDPGLPAWFGGFVLLSFFYRREASEEDKDKISHGRTLSLVMSCLIRAAFVVGTSYVVGTLLHWIP